MKTDFHPEYHPVAFQDMTTGTRFITRSTAKSAKVEQIDGVDHYIISSGVTSDTHPFFTGQKQFVDTAGRIDKFMVRHFIKPGITGLAQVSGYRGEVETDNDIIKRVKLDIFYLENWSLLLDIKIVFQTVYNALRGEEKAY